jgi:hypothetical protein
MIVDSISHLLKLVSNQIMVAMPMKGKIRPPGILNVFSAVSGFLILNLIVAKITVR